MRISKDGVLEIVRLCQTMVDGRNDGTISAVTYTEKFKPYLNEFKDKYDESPNLYLQDELKFFFQSNLQGINSNLEYKSFGFWGRSIYNYVWTCVYYDFKKDAIPASFSPQLYILANKDGIKFGFCYGHYIDNSNEMVLSAINNKTKFQTLKNCLQNDSELSFFNSEKEEVTARPEKLFGDNERISVKSDDDLIKNWSNNSLLIKEFPKDKIPENIGEIIQSTLINLKSFYISLLPKDVSKAQNSNIPYQLFKAKEDLSSSGLFLSDDLITRFS